MEFQQFGTIETETGVAEALLCIDADKPTEFMLQWHGAGIISRGILADVTRQGDEFDLVPRWLYRVNDKCGLWLPAVRSAEENAWMGATRAHLVLRDGGLQGQWTGLEGATGAIALKPLMSAEGDQEAYQCNSWEEFKAWASRIRTERDAFSFRGHGSSEFSLRTTIHRMRRYRLERYLFEEWTSPVSVDSL